MNLSQLEINCPRCNTPGKLSDRLPGSHRYRFLCSHCKFDGIYIPRQHALAAAASLRDLIRQKHDPNACPTCG